MSLATGASVWVTEAIDDDATVEERVAGLRAAVAAALGRDPAGAVLAVACDGCGDTTIIDYNAPKLPPGWDSNADGEFCPACRQQAG
jgi:hypothetical protein